MLLLRLKEVAFAKSSFGGGAPLAPALTTPEPITRATVPPAIQRRSCIGPSFHSPQSARKWPRLVCRRFTLPASEPRGGCMDRRAQLQTIAAIQARQLGLITVDQARREAIKGDLLYQEVRAGRMRRLRAGVFATTAAPRSYEQEVLAAVLAAAGPVHAAASHETAAY